MNNEGDTRFTFPGKTKESEAIMVLCLLIVWFDFWLVCYPVSVLLNELRFVRGHVNLESSQPTFLFSFRYRCSPCVPSKCIVYLLCFCWPLN